MSEWTVHTGDCLEVMAGMEANTFDAIVTDPPYGLAFMGKAWDHAVPGPEFFAAMMRVAKPGAHIVAFGGTRLYHRMTCAMEDAGWEIRDCLMWLYAQGFPKSLNYGCKCGGTAIPYNHDKQTTECGVRPVRKSNLSQAVNACEERGQVLHAVMPEQSASSCGSAWSESESAGTEQPSVEWRGNISQGQGELHRAALCSMPGGVDGDGAGRRLCDGASACCGHANGQDASKDGVRTSHQPQPEGQQAGESGGVLIEPGPQTVRGSRNARPNMERCDTCGGVIGCEGWGTALKPAWEPIVLARKPLDGTVAQNHLRHGCGGVNVDACRIRTEPGDYDHPGNTGIKDNTNVYGTFQHKNQMPPSPLGRWPANLILDAEAGAVLDGQAGVRTSGSIKAHHQRHTDGGNGKTHGRMAGVTGPCRDGNTGGASRFFYCSKSSKADRGEGNLHPTVKPTDLMRWLARLVTPQGGTILDPFTGSGSTGKAARMEGFGFVGIEREPEYADIARARIAAVEPMLIGGVG